MSVQDPLTGYNVGDLATNSKTITDEDIINFSEISGDRNPIHLDDQYAEQSQYGKRIAHGLMSVSYFSALFGMTLPGPGCVYVSQDLKFLRPVYIGDTVKAVVKIRAINYEKRRIYFKTYCEVEGKKVISGNAEIYLPNKKQ